MVATCLGKRDGRWHGLIYTKTFCMTYIYMRIYCNGVFDLFHYGHARMFEAIKTKYPKCTLLVGVCQDEDVRYYKGDPILNHDERCESIRHCKWVDEIISDAPWIINDTFMKTHDIDFVAHDSCPYSCEGIQDIYGELKAKGKFISTTRTLGISSTHLKTRIGQDKK